MTLTSKLLFRRSALDLLNLCKKVNLPVTVLSGGIQELIEAAFQILKADDKDSDLSHVSIISNKFTYAPSHTDTNLHVISGFATPVVHP